MRDLNSDTMVQALNSISTQDGLWLDVDDVLSDLANNPSSKEYLARLGHLVLEATTEHYNCEHDGGESMTEMNERHAAEDILKRVEDLRRV